jgi:Ni,Fe-hydrogenase III small subunit
MMPAGDAEPIPHDHAVEVAEAAAESAVETIVAEAQDAAEGATDDLPGPEDVQLPGDVPEPTEAVTDVADVIDQAADESPRQRHWFHRNLVGGR